MSTQNAKQPKQVLVIGSERSDMIGQSLEEFKGQGYNFHFVVPDYPNTTAKLKKYLSEGKPIKFDGGAFIDKMMGYVGENDIDGVIGFNDMDMLLVAAIVGRCGLPGPTPEAAFLTLHKYYCRLAEKSRMWFEGVDMFDDVTWRQKMRYPCWVKPSCMMSAIGGRKINNEREMEAVLLMYRETLSPYLGLTKSIFNLVLDKTKYLLADVMTLIAEELVAGDDVEFHCVEGWVDGDGTCYVVNSHDDRPPTEARSVFDWEIVPSSMQPDVWRLVQSHTESLVKNIGLRSCSFLMEVFIRSTNGKPRIDTVEINDRIGYNYHSLHFAAARTSPLLTAIFVACGEYQRARTNTDIILANLKTVYTIMANLWVTHSGRMSDLVNFEAIDYFEQHPEEGVLGLNNKHVVILEYDRDDDVQVALSEAVRVGQFLLVGPEPEALPNRVEEVRAKLIRK